MSRDGCSTPSSSRRNRRLQSQWRLDAFGFETNQGLLGTLKFETNGDMAKGCSTPSSSRRPQARDARLLDTFKFETVGRRLRVRDESTANGCSTPSSSSSSERDRRPVARRGRSAPSSLRTTRGRYNGCSTPSSSRQMRLHGNGCSTPLEFETNALLQRLLDAFEFETFETPRVTARLLDTFKFETQQTASPQGCRLLSAFESETTCPLLSAPESETTATHWLLDALKFETARRRQIARPLTSMAELNYYLVPHSSTIYVISRS